MDYIHHAGLEIGCTCLIIEKITYIPKSILY